MLVHSTRDKPLPQNSRIAIATCHGRPYYYFSTLLRRIDVIFDSIIPDHMNSYNGHVVLTTESEYLECQSSLPAIFFEDVIHHPPAAVYGLILQKITHMYYQSTNSLVIGIDPGQRNGLSITYCGQEIESSIHTSVDSLVSKMISIFSNLSVKRRLIKIGDGDMNTANKIINSLNLRFCSSFELEIVDESRTSLKIKNFNCRSRRDILSARHISRRDGRHRKVLPLSLTG